MKYTCKLCPRQFESSQSLNCHVRHCRLAQEGKTWFDVAARPTKAKFDRLRDERTRPRPKCIACGKSVNELRGKFCSSSCAAKITNKGKRHSQTTKGKIGGKLRKLPMLRTCPVCDKGFTLTANNSKTCSPSCGSKLAFITRPSSERSYKGLGGLRAGCDRNYRYGHYRGIYCASSYELAFVINCFNRGLQVERSKNVLYFTWNGKRTRYYPDFEVAGRTFEIKGYFREKDAAKLRANPDVTLIDKDAITKIKANDPILKMLSWEKITELYDENSGAQKTA